MLNAIFTSFKLEGMDGGLSDSTLLTSMSGFLYSPRYFPKVAWSFMRGAGMSCQVDTNPVLYEAVHVDTGGVWDSVNHAATCTESGLYIMAFTARKCLSPLYFWVNSLFL